MEDASEHEVELKQFEDNVKLLYEYGSRSFLTKTTVGDQETFYTHTLWYYMPHLARETYCKHGIGLGVFTMQGFEHRNKERKNTLRRFSNRRGKH